MAYINKVNIGASTYLIEPTLYVSSTTLNTNTGVYSATLDNTFELVSGVTIQIKFSTTNSASANLNINNIGNKAIYYNGTPVAENQIQADHTYTLVYNGTQWEIIGDLNMDARIPIIRLAQGV